MMKRLTIRVSKWMLFSVFSILLITQGLYGQTIIDFDTDPSGIPIANGTIVNSVYTSIGVTFEKVGPGVTCGAGPNVYANSNQPSGFGSPPNVVSTCGGGTASDISEKDFGMIHALFTKPASKVCIDVLPDDPGEPNHFAVLRSYGASDNLLSSTTSTPGSTETLCISGTEIWGVRFSGSWDKFARFDNLSVTFADVWKGAASFIVKMTENYTDNSGNVKFNKYPEPFTGMMEIYVEEERLVANGNGCYLYFISDDGETKICITDIAEIYSQSIKVNATDTFYLKGTGTFSSKDDGKDLTGLIFLDLTKGLMKKDKSGNLISIILGGKLDGGVRKDFIFSGSFRAILTK